MAGGRGDSIVKQGKTLTELAIEIERQSAAKADYVAPAGALAFSSNGQSTLAISGVDQAPLGVTDLAHRQIGEYLGIPASFYDKLRGANDLLVDRMIQVDPLFDVMLNTMMRARGADKRMVRTLDGRARAFLSNRFRPLDHDAIAAQILPLLLEMNLDLSASSMEITDNRLYLKLVNPRVSSHVANVDDIVQAGVIVSNSEVGLGAFSVQPLIYRLVCKNGMVVNDLAVRKYHTGGRLQSSDEQGTLYLADETVQARDRATILEMRDLIAGALSEALFGKTVEKLREAAGVKIQGDPAKAVEVVTKRYSLTEGERGGVLRALIEGHDLSLWGMANAITATAQTVESYDRSTELEAIGGRIIEQSREQVRELVTA
jgi:hypothetical protein